MKTQPYTQAELRAYVASRWGSLTVDGTFSLRRSRNVGRDYWASVTKLAKSQINKPILFS